MSNLESLAAEAKRNPPTGTIPYLRALARVSPEGVDDAVVTYLRENRVPLDQPGILELAASVGSPAANLLRAWAWGRATETERVIWDMLEEPTGTHFLDSGGAYGRHWQRNQGRIFPLEPATIFEVDAWGWGENGDEHAPRSWELSYTLNLFHFLAERLTYEKELDDELTSFALAPEREHENWFKCAADWLKSRFPNATGIYGEGGPVTEYTYNVDNYLSQDVQYTYWEVDDEDYSGGFYLLCVHGGCDARGGFTRFRVFSDQGELSLIGDVSRGRLMAEGDPTHAIPEDQALLPGMVRPRIPEVNIDLEGGHASVEMWPYPEGMNRPPLGYDLAKYPVSGDLTRRGDGTCLVIDRETKKLYWTDGRELVG